MEPLTLSSSVTDTDVISLLTQIKTSYAIPYSEDSFLKYKDAKKNLRRLAKEKLLTEQQRTKICEFTNTYFSEKKRYRWERDIQPEKRYLIPAKLYKVKYYPSEQDKAILKTLNFVEHEKLFSCLDRNKKPEPGFLDILEPIETQSLMRMIDAAKALEISEVHERLLTYLQNRIRDNSNMESVLITSVYTKQTIIYKLAKYCAKDCEEKYRDEYFAKVLFFLL